MKVQTEELSDWLYVWVHEQYYYEKDNILSRSGKTKYYLPDTLVDSLINLWYDMRFNWEVERDAKKINRTT